MATYVKKTAEIWARLVEKFGLFGGSGGNAEISGSIQLISSVDELLASWGAKSSGNIVTQTGETTMMACPARKRWTVLVLNAERVSGDYTLSNVKIKDVSAAVTIILPGVTAGGSSAYLESSSGGWIMDEGDVIIFTNAAVSVPGTYICRIMVKEEDAH